MVAYAAARHITIVPEIEMPGHSGAALAAYPEFSCTGGPTDGCRRRGFHRASIARATTRRSQFLADVLAEVIELFPGKYIHIGGDEVPTRTTGKNAPNARRA